MRLVLICGGWIVDREEGLLCLLSAIFRPIGCDPSICLPLLPNEMHKANCNNRYSEMIDDLANNLF